MARRRIAEQPASRLAIWARRLAVFSLPVVMLAIIIARAGLLEIEPVLATFAAALAMAVIAILMALFALGAVWRHGIEGLGAATTAILIGIALLAYPAYLGSKALRLPAIADITTDPIDPPRFETVGRLRSREANPIVYAGLYAAELQKTAYPDIVPLETTTNAQTAYDAARAVITKRRWQVINERPPQPGRRDGYIEAVARTPIMGFRDDVAVRIRAVGQGARVDVRSASRYGRHDFGTNASRVSALSESIEEAVDNLKPDKTPDQAKKPKKTDAKAKTQPADKRR
jgi:uncharacterized protein (DUF1499 family)